MKGSGAGQLQPADSTTWTRIMIVPLGAYLYWQVLLSSSLSLFTFFFSFPLCLTLTLAFASYLSLLPFLCPSGGPLDVCPRCEMAEATYGLDAKWFR